MTTRRETSPDLGCLVLAAGAGRRFEGPKQLAPLRGRPLLAHVIALAAPWDPLVVLGARAEEIRAQVDVPRAVIASDWAEGIAASLRVGVAALAGFERVLVLLGDQPWLSRAAIDGVLAAGDTARATYAGVPGHPVVLGAEVLPRVAGLRGDEGARRLLDGVATFEASHLCDPTDIDTPDQLPPGL